MHKIQPSGRGFWVALLLAAVAGGCQQTPADNAAPHQGQHGGGDAGVTLRSDGAPLLDGIGPTGMTISTDSAQAQAYFNQALTLAYGFNHAEAVRSFREAAKYDATCGMCYWGVALALGPNINAPMADEAIPEAWAAVQKAKELSVYETQRERDYIDAVATRYSATGEDRVSLDQLYSGSMKGLVERYPQDLNARTLYAESLMDLVPWNYWEADGAPGPYTTTLVDALESVMAEDSQHVGALHLYIHAMEQFSPARAEVAADTLGPLVPVAGHLVHMPSHIYLRVGRYDDAVTANTKAALADEDYIAQCNAQGLYPAAYHPHNVHFLWYAAMMSGRQELAVATARRLYGNVHMEMARQLGSVQQFLSVPGSTYVRFGMWDAALAEPPPPAGVPLATAQWHYVQGVAAAATGDLRAARSQLRTLEKMTADGAVAQVPFRPGIPVADMLVSIGTDLVRARIARQEGDSAAELAALNAAVKTQDALPYTEPPFWHFPVRQALGAAYLRAGDSAQAARVYREDLEYFPRNGWSLAGLMRAEPEAADMKTLKSDFAQTWKNADAQPLSGL